MQRLVLYSDHIQVLMDHFHVDTEANLIVGLVEPPGGVEKASDTILLLGQSYWHDLRYQAQTEVQQLISRFYRQHFLDSSASHESDAWLEKEQHYLAKASAWYLAAYHESTNSKRHCISFPWIAHRQLCHLKRRHKEYSAARVYSTL